MTHHTITDIDRITAALDPTGAIEHLIWDQLTDCCYWDSVGQIIAQLESAACAHGSWGGMIYTRDILDKLSDPQWVQDIEDTVAAYEDATGEAPVFDPYGSGFSLSAVVTFAVDWSAQCLASRLRYLDRVAVVVASVDAMDPHPDVIAFDTVCDAEDWVAEEVERRVQYQVDHSAHPVTEADREALTEIETTLFKMTEEAL